MSELYQNVIGLWVPSSLIPAQRSGFYSLCADIERRFKKPFSVVENKNLILLGIRIDEKSVGATRSETLAATHLNVQERDISARVKQNYTPTYRSSAKIEVFGASRLFLARGSAGSSSMYYKKTRSGVAFSSNIALFNRCGLEVDRESCAAFLHFFYIPSPKTIYSGVTSLMPDEAAEFSADDQKDKCVLSFRQQVKSASTTSQDSLEDPVDRFGDLLKQSVSQALAGENGRAALLLSGGKDSSGLAVASALSGNTDLLTVTAAFPGHQFDESDDAKIVAGTLGLRHKSIQFSNDQCLDAWDNLPERIGQPVGDPAVLPVSMLLSELRDEFSLILDGTGNDSYFQILCGERRRLIWDVKRRFPKIFDALAEMLCRAGSSDINWLRQILRRKEEQFVSWVGFDTAQARSLTGARVEWDSLPLYALYSRCRTADEHITRTLCEIWEPETAYRKVVQQTDYFGLLTNYPYLSADLSSYVRAVPAHLRASGGTNKTLLRQFLAQHLPRSITDKPKGAFVFPKGLLLREETNPGLRDVFRKSAYEDVGLTSWHIVEALLDRFKHGDKSIEGRLYALYLLLDWLKWDKATDGQLREIFA